MGLQSRSFRGDPALEACLVSDPAHIVPGAVGVHVGKIQRALIKVDFARIDSAELVALRFGPSTAMAVLAFKTKRNIVNRSYQTQPDNIVGKMTIAALDAELLRTEPPSNPSSPRELSRGMTGRDVYTLQRVLNHHLSEGRVPLVADGIFGPKTEARVKEFQTLNRMYLVIIPSVAGAPSEPLEPTGVVDQTTLMPLLDMRVVTAYDSRFQLVSGDNSLRHGGDPQGNFAEAPAGDPPNPPPRRTVIITSAGSQANVNPWDFSRFVLTGQVTHLAKNDGRPDFLLTAGGQAALNSSGANGIWSGQGFVQMSLANFPFAKFGDFDLLNPLVQFMISHNHGAAQQQNTFGAAIGNQLNYSLITKLMGVEKVDVLSLFLNAQAVTNIDLSNGKCAAPSGQFMLGATYTFDANF